jgi:uncharacterized protein (TIGR04255 family)
MMRWQRGWRSGVCAWWLDWGTVLARAIDDLPQSRSGQGPLHEGRPFLSVDAHARGGPPRHYHITVMSLEKLDAQRAPLQEIMTRREIRPMGAGRPLPKFRRPPLIEVVHGVQFRRLPMTIVHLGQFYPRVEDRYPRVQTVAPLPPTREVMGGDPEPMQFALQFVQTDTLPRTWFVSNDDTMLIQLQSDRLLLNWRRGSGEIEYPHFEKVSSEFRRIFGELQSFAAQFKLGAIEPNQCEMTYINHLLPRQSGAAALPTDVFRIWTGAVGPEWDLPLDALAFNARYVLHRYNEACGRLSVSLSSVVGPGHDRAMQLDLTARGTPETPSVEGVLAFHDMAHENIVRCFAGITTEAAHQQWDRWQ